MKLRLIILAIAVLIALLTIGETAYSLECPILRDPVDTYRSYADSNIECGNPDSSYWQKGATLGDSGDGYLYCNAAIENYKEDLITRWQECEEVEGCEYKPEEMQLQKTCSKMAKDDELREIYGLEDDKDYYIVSCVATAKASCQPKPGFENYQPESTEAEIVYPEEAPFFIEKPEGMSDEEYIKLVKQNIAEESAGESSVVSTPGGKTTTPEDGTKIGPDEKTAPPTPGKQDQSFPIAIAAIVIVIILVSFFFGRKRIGKGKGKK